MKKKYLAIDYGTKRVGIAVADMFLAEPYTVIPNTKDLYQQLCQIIQEQRPDVVVVGLSEQMMAEETQVFARQLKQYLTERLEVMPEFAFADETLSSVEVYEKLYQTGKRDIRQNGPIDHYAAAQILQEYLDLHQNDESR